MLYVTVVLQCQGRKCIDVLYKYNYAYKNTTTRVATRILSYSLFGKHSWEKYGKYVTSVAEEAERSVFYKTWRVRIYHDGQSLDKSKCDEMRAYHKNLDFYDVRNISYLGDMSLINGMVWRYFPLGDLSIDIVCARDLDSPLMPREEHAVREWLKTHKLMHVMRDSVHHQSIVMGGLLCIKNDDRLLSKKILNIIVKYAYKRTATGSEASHGQDQNLFNEHIWPFMKSNTLHHDSYYCGRFKGSTPFPTKRNESISFVGCYRPCAPVGIWKPGACPVECRPKNDTDWTYC